MSLTRVLVYYHQCKPIQSGLTIFESTPASYGRGSVKVDGRCVTHAVFVDHSSSSRRNSKPQAFCGMDGMWLGGMPRDQCQCRSGYQMTDRIGNGKSSCEECPVNYYKSDSSDKCRQCPKNKEARRRGAIRCKCRAGFRCESTTDGQIDEQCYKPAGTPRLNIDSVATTYVEYVITAPTDESELVQLEYQISICIELPVLPSTGSGDCRLIDRSVRYENNDKPRRIENLDPETDYILTVKAENIVTKSTDKFNKAEIRFRTNQETPDEIKNFKNEVNREEQSLILSWDELEVSGYILEVTGPNDVLNRYNLTQPKFTEKNIIHGNYMISVYAVNSAGPGPITSEEITVVIDDSLPIHMYAVAGAGGIFAVILLVVSAYCCCCRQNDRAAERKARNEEGTGLFSASDKEAGLSPGSNGTTRPLNTYESGPEELMPDFHFMEINPIDIQIEKTILGEGEFAEVRKAYIVDKLGERIPVAAKQLKTGVGMRAGLDFVGEYSNV